MDDRLRLCGPTIWHSCGKKYTGNYGGTIWGASSCNACLMWALSEGYGWTAYKLKRVLSTMANGHGFPPKESHWDGVRHDVAQRVDAIHRTLSIRFALARTGTAIEMFRGAA